MNDLISRQAAIKDMAELQGRAASKSELKGISKAWKRIKALPSAQTGWIPVTKSLPENDNDVLVTDGTDCAVAYWRTDAQAWDDSMHGWCDLYGLEVVAWMPLPEPYKETDNG